MRAVCASMASFASRSWCSCASSFSKSSSSNFRLQHDGPPPPVPLLEPEPHDSEDVVSVWGGQVEAGHVLIKHQFERDA